MTWNMTHKRRMSFTWQMSDMVKGFLVRWSRISGRFLAMASTVFFLSSSPIPSILTIISSAVVFTLCPLPHLERLLKSFLCLGFPHTSLMCLFRLSLVLNL